MNSPTNHKIRPVFRFESRLLFPLGNNLPLSYIPRLHWHFMKDEYKITKGLLLANILETV